MNFKKLVLVFTASLLLFLGGCASGYKEFYKPAQGATPEAIAAIRVNKAPAIPIIERAQPADSSVVLDAYGKRGYVMVGSSMFNSGKAVSEDEAVSQGKAVGADLVLIFNPKYTGSITSSVPLTTPTSTTTYSTGSATAYGAGGSVTAYGSGSSTTYGSQTTYVPMTVHRSDYGAVFFIKRSFILGVFVRDLNDSERQELQTNKGVFVRLVADNTPAFNADILVGDVVTAFDGVSVSNSTSFSELQRERRGKQVSVSLLRRGQRVDKQIQLNP
jgi:membrane-associated protease RseP (regulator of RpoE activity)